MYDRILIASDGSNLSKKAVAHGLKLAKATGAEVVAVHVVPRYPVSYFEGSVALGNNEVAQIEARWRERGEAIVAEASKSAGNLNVKVKTVVVTSDRVAESLIKAATKYKSDLIVMASHGRKGLSRVLLGSETMDVLTHSKVPVLVLR